MLEAPPMFCDQFSGAPLSSSSLTSGVAGRYAVALFQLADQAGSLEAVEADLDAVSALMADSADLRRVVASPAFSSHEQGKALAAVLAGAKIGGLSARFIGVIAQNRRLFALPAMITAFKAMAAQKRGEIGAEVTSAVALTPAQQEALAASLKEKLGLNVKLTTSVDPSLLGGLIVKVGSKMIDTSLKTKLNALKYAMKEVG